MTVLTGFVLSLTFCLAIAGAWPALVMVLVTYGGFVITVVVIGWISNARQNIPPV